MKSNSVKPYKNGNTELSLKKTFQKSVETWRLPSDCKKSKRRR